MTEEELQNLIGSNAKAIAALTSLVSDTSRRVDTVAETVNASIRQMVDMQRQLIDMQRQTSNIEYEIRDLRADTRELQLENNRILRFLEQRGNDAK